MTYVHAQQAPRKAVVAPAEQDWHQDAQKYVSLVSDMKRTKADCIDCRTLEEIGGLKQDFRIKARAVERSKAGLAKTQKTEKLTRIAIGHKRALRETGRELRMARRKFNDHIDVQAKRQCRSLCKEVSDKLPRELRNIIYDDLITTNNATFYEGPDKKIELANGCAPLQHYFNAEYTGNDMHRDVLEELNHKGVRFDFRHRHGLLREAFTYYTSVHDTDLAKLMNNIGITLNLGDTKDHELVTDHLKALFELRVGTSIHVFIESAGKTRSQIARSFTRVIRSVVMFLGRLTQAGYRVTVVMNPSYVRSTVKNNVESRFSIIHAQDFRYSFTLRKHEYSATGILYQLQKVCELET
jgi:hypothetical protein